MRLTVVPSESLSGSIRLPASKSYSIRAFITASCGGASSIIGPSSCDDARVAVAVCRQRGFRVVHDGEGTWSVSPRRATGRTPVYHVRESGTVLRLLLPLLSLNGRPAVVTGEGTLVGRPNQHLLEALRRHGMEIRGTGGREGVPIAYGGGTLSGGRMAIDGTLSSQFISALLMACPQLEKDTRLTITGRQIVSSDYIVMTLQVLEKAGITIKRLSRRELMIPGRQVFRGLKRFSVPSDYGLSAFLLAAGALVPSRLNLSGCLRDDLVQADGRILGFLKKMGVPYRKTSRSLKLKGPCVLKGGDFSLRDCPDLVPIMSVLALFAKGRTRLKDIRHARAKESDRISDLRKELLKTGADVRETSDQLEIHPLPDGAYRRNVELNPHHDHRLAMSFAVLGLRLGTRIPDIECTAKSYPDFVQHLRALGARVRQHREG